MMMKTDCCVFEREEAKGDRRKLQNEELHDVYLDHILLRR
jgi:hypothetical protein